MIKKSMFFCEEPKIKDYCEMDIVDIIREYLLFKGTWDGDGRPANKKVRVKDLCSSAFWLYSLKSNATNKRNVEYYCEKKAREAMILKDNLIIVPAKLWEECDKYNLDHYKKLL